MAAWGGRGGPESRRRDTGDSGAFAGVLEVMTFDDYQREAKRTSAAPWPERERLLVQTLGLCGEAGEVADLVKKDAWHGKPLTSVALADELGDVLWYLADIATARGLSLSAIAEGNIRKLQQRYPGGFTLGGGNR